MLFDISRDTRQGADWLISSSPERVAEPAGYKGLYAFHKYWGKKPHEPIAYVINHLTEPGQIIVDPFVGSGTVGREALLQSRRFIGSDINPIAVELTRLLSHPPNITDIKQSVRDIQHQVREKILESYTDDNSGTWASHYLWEQSRLLKVWTWNKGRRIEREPTQQDYTLIQSFEGYQSTKMRAPQFFSNSRINTNVSMGVNDILTCRAQRNIDLLIKAIEDCPPVAQSALRLCLTAASGQMSKMVFAVTNRGKTGGKTNGKVSTRVEVGSWVIGYWRPRIHFEVNVWNCFQRRVDKLCRAITAGDPLSQTIVSDDPLDVIEGRTEAAIALSDSLRTLDSIPDGAVDLLIADPPHSDRIPYLELSEFWNSILNSEVDFEREIVISNARERKKNQSNYVDSIRDFIERVPRVLSRQGYFVLIFNARQAERWSGFHTLKFPAENNGSPLTYLGYFPCVYSSGSVVQDNRKGSLQTDCAMVFSHPHGNPKQKIAELSRIPNWSRDFPANLSNSGE